MQGRVVGLVQDRAAIDTDGEGITLIEFTGYHSTDVGDVLTGNLHGEGMETLTNESKSEEVGVSIEDCGCDRQKAHNFLLQ